VAGHELPKRSFGFVKPGTEIARNPGSKLPFFRRKGNRKELAKASLLPILKGRENIPIRRETRNRLRFYLSPSLLSLRRVEVPAGAPLQLKEKHLYNKFLILLWFYGFLEEEQ